MIEQVGEQIKVVARFIDGKFEPMMFNWRSRGQRVKSVTGRWAEHDGQYRIYHFSVVSESDVFYEMSFHTKNMGWTLDRFMPDQP